MLAETQEDYKMKYAILTDTFNIVMDKSESIKTQVGGYGLICNDGPVKSHFQSKVGTHSSSFVAPICLNMCSIFPSHNECIQNHEKQIDGSFSLPK